jgi:hypothetical protein
MNSHTVGREPYPDVTAGERKSLEQFLDFHRAGVLRTLDDLTDAEAAAQVLAATDLTAGGIVKHLAAVEDLWFSHKLFDVPSAEPWRSAPFDQDPDWEFHSAAGNSVAELRELIPGIEAQPVTPMTPAPGSRRSRGPRWHPGGSAPGRGGAPRWRPRRG